MKVSVEQVENIINSDLPRRKIIKYVQYLFSKEENIETFCRYCLPNAFTLPFAPFHHDLVTDYLKPYNTANAEPRGFGKSTLIGQGMVLWETVNKRFSYGVYCSQNHDKSVEFLEPIRKEIKQNKRLKFIYPWLSIKSLADEDGKDREDIFDISGVRIKALSFEKNIRGMKYINQRPDRIWFDDIEDDQRVINPELRRKDYDKINKQMIPSLDPDGGVIKFFGTILHHDSALVKKIKLWNGRINRACELDENNNVIESTIIFPARFTKDKLEQLRRDMGTASFQSEYMNSPVDDTSAIIKRKYVESCYDESFSFDDDEKYDIKIQGVDFAFSDRVGADSSAFLGIGKNSNCIDLVSFFKKQGMSTLEQFDYIRYLSSINCFDDNVLEENSIGDMKKHIGDYGFPYTLFWTGANDVAQPSSDDVFLNGNVVKRYVVGKNNMVKRLGAFFERNFESIREGEGYTFRIPYRTDSDKEKAHLLRDELCSWAFSDGKLVEIGIHPDSPIALGLALERLNLDTFDGEGGMLEL